MIFYDQINITISTNLYLTMLNYINIFKQQQTTRYIHVYSIYIIMCHVIYSERINIRWLKINALMRSKKATVGN